MSFYFTHNYHELLVCICILFLLHPILHQLYNNTIVVQYQWYISCTISIGTKLLVERHSAPSCKIMTLISENITLYLWPRENDLGLLVWLPLCEFNEGFNASMWHFGWRLIFWTFFGLRLKYSAVYVYILKKFSCIKIWEFCHCCTVNTFLGLSTF